MRWLRSPSARAKSHFWFHLATVLDAGRSLPASLGTWAGRGRIGAAARALAAAAEEGVPLADAMAARPELFDPVESALVRAGEMSGTLGAACRSLAARFEREAEFRRGLLAPLGYPAFLVHFALLALPIPTIVSAGLGSYLWTVGGSLFVLYGGALGAIVLHFALEESLGYGRFVRSLPFVGRAIRALAYARFARSLAALHGAGLPFDRALPVAGETLGIAAWGEEVRRAARAVGEGATVGAAVARLPAVPFEVTTAVEVGETSGSLEETLSRAAADLESQGSAALTRLAKILPVAVFLLVGTWIGVKIVSSWAGMYGGFGAVR